VSSADAMQSGIAHHRAGRLKEAAAFYRQVLSREPANPDALHLLGVIAQQRGEFAASIELIARAIAANPAVAEYHYNLGNSHFAMGNFAIAAKSFFEAEKRKSDFADAIFNLANALVNDGRVEEAIAAYNRVLKIRPRDAATLDNLARVLKDNGQLDDALALFRQALESRPDFAAAHSDLIYALHFHPDSDSSVLLAECRNWAERHERPLAGSRYSHGQRAVTSAGRLKIGFISADFRRHPVGRFMLPLLENLDPKNLEVSCYSDVKFPDSLTTQLQPRSHHWRQTANLTDADLARMIHEDRIDILIDLSLHTPGNRLGVFARKPAPVQATWLGYAGTTGLETVDLRLTDRFIDPPGGDEFYSERSVRLPNCFWCYQAPEKSPEINPLPAEKNGFLTFGSFNHFTKISATVLDVWASILSSVPRSRLVIHCHRDRHGHVALQYFSARGISESRIEFTGLQPLEKYLAEYHRIDIALDSFPYGGGMTTCDALWMGVPVITLRGRTAVGRGGASILSNLQMPDWIAETPESYADLARKWAGDPKGLAAVRATLRDRMARSPLMDARQFAADMEAVFHEMYRSV
jgi:predicted O-linked N-acetylglucosamine transferase (SPINDLY family)